MISIIVPCFNEEAVLKRFYSKIKQVLGKTNYELIFINDGSGDSTLSIIKHLAQTDAQVKYISFSRNFGKEAAMMAGLSRAQGSAAIIMDADLQHPPSLIPEMIRQYEKGYDQVIAKRNRKGESLARSIPAKLYYKLMNRFVDVTLTPGIGDYRLLSRSAINAVLSLNEYNRFSKGLFSWIGFKKKIIEYENVIRESGSSTWTFPKLLNYGIDGVISFNNKPLRISIYIGLMITMVALSYILYMLCKILLYGVDVPGYFTLISSILLLGGIQLTFLGVIGEYIGRIYYESKQRPHFIVEEETTEEKSTRQYPFSL